MLNITESAQSEIRKRFKDGNRFRVFIDSGGCSGMTAHFLVDKSQHEEDLLFLDDLVIIDRASLEIAREVEAVLDFSENLTNQGFVLKTEKRSSCGCGGSFSF